MEHLILETVCKHRKDKKVIRNSQHGFIKGKSYLTSLISFCGEMTTLLDKGRAVDIVFQDFSKAFDAVPHKIPLRYSWNLLNYGLGEQAVR